METEYEESNLSLTDDGVQQMIELAERLRVANGGELDDSAVFAVAEATGAPVEYVRLALRLRRSQEKETVSRRLRTNFLSLEPEVKRYVAAGGAAIAIALLASLEAFTRSFQGFRAGEAWPIFGMLKLIAITLGIYNICVSRETKTAIITGAITGGLMFALYGVLSFVLNLRPVEPMLLFFWTVFGAIGGAGAHAIVGRYRKQLGLKDPVKERQELLRQLVQLQDKLRSGEQIATFVSVDIVGSTKMKAGSDSLSVEFTFNEYHQFVDMVSRRHGGRVHSTAGDGVTMVFDHPQQAFSASKFLQAGMIELNTFRNKIGTPIVLRCGIHTGTVMAPDAGDIKTLNFAHVIDIAAHMQKLCPPGGIAVSESAAMHLPGGPAAIGSQRIDAQGVPGIVWAPKVTIPRSLSADGPPPVPAGAPSISTDH